MENETPHCLIECAQSFQRSLNCLDEQLETYVARIAFIKVTSLHIHIPEGFIVVVLNLSDNFKIVDSKKVEVVPGKERRVTMLRASKDNEMEVTATSKGKYILSLSYAGLFGKILCVVS